MGSAPSAKWQELFMNYVKRNPIPEIDNLHKIYAENPNNDILKKLTLLSTPTFLLNQAYKEHFLS
ncbi:hypothetical protein Ldro_0279 [Legionella drozanskii LLAP-1]|uniref:Uncharacterized protein n=2 Tax=Legionella drozanskii TaxID=96228 RepID=A0A0W0TBB6_9GAMM|nr:hypothetical protein Ldro_0279 [Legionella drozanskii LLAP-1]